MKNKYGKSNLKLFGILVVTILCVYPTYALLITEINFDPSGSDSDREWIEIFNDTNSSIDLTTIKFFEANVNHGIESMQTDKNILSGEFVVLVQDMNKFKTDSANYSGKIFKSSFSLSNTGETMSLKDKEGNVLNSVTYTQSQTGAKDGETISFDGSTWVKTTASPGSGNLIISNTNNSTTTTPTENTNSTTTSTTTNTTSENTTNTIFNPVYFYRSYFPESEKIYINSGENKAALAGAEVLFEAKVVTGDKRNLTDANLFWSFGDGETAEGKKAMHVYKYPGEYTVNVDGYWNGNMSSDKIYVKVTNPDLKINLKKDEAGEAVVEIKNNSDVEVDIGGLILNSSSSINSVKKESVLPKKLSILPKRNIILSDKVLKMATDTDQVSLNFKDGKVIAKFGNKVTNNKTSVIATSTYAQNVFSDQKVGIKIFTKDQYEKELQTISTSTNSSSTKIVIANKLKKNYIKPVKVVKKSEEKIVEVKKEQQNEDSFVIKEENKSFITNLFSIFR